MVNWVKNLVGTIMCLEGGIGIGIEYVNRFAIRLANMINDDDVDNKSGRYRYRAIANTL